MTLIIELKPEDELRLQSAARLRGVEPADYAHQLVLDNLPAIQHLEVSNAACEYPAIALFRKWAEEDAKMSPEQIAQEVQDFEELKRNLNANRRATGERLVFPE